DSSAIFYSLRRTDHHEFIAPVLDFNQQTLFNLFQVFVQASAKVSKTLGIFRFQHQALGKGLAIHVLKKRASGGIKVELSIPIKGKIGINFSL
ncbi:MAG: hypothetical protein ACI934_002167, partial [Pseudohongiellaceae bacterium]